MKTPNPLSEPPDFSLVLGGPLYQLWLRTKLVRPPMELLHRRILAFVVVTWLPLVLLTVLAGSFVGEVNVPFLVDLDAQVRFLVTLPLLIGAELIVHCRMREVVKQFLEHGLVAPEDRPRFQEIVSRAMRLRNSVVVELLFFVFAFTAAHWVWSTQVTLHVATWYAVPVAGTEKLTGPGFWYAFISLPIVRFIVLRWFFRIFIWYQFLWRVSRLRLRLNPLHPDRAGGLGFLSYSLDAFAPMLIAQSAFFAGDIGNRIWHQGAKLPAFELEIVGILVVLMLVVLLPLMFFIFQMASAKRAALREYGLVAGHYVDEFRQKWLRRSETPAEELLGTGDIQSLADLGNSFEVVREMRLVPFGRSAVLRLAILSALPLFPLTLTMIPLEEMLSRLVKMVF